MTTYYVKSNDGRFLADQSMLSLERRDTARFRYVGESLGIGFAATFGSRNLALEALKPGDYVVMMDHGSLRRV